MTTTTLKVIFPWRRFASVSPAAPAPAAVLGAAFRRALSSTTIACCCCIHSPQHYYQNCSFRFCRLRRALNALFLRSASTFDSANHQQNSSSSEMSQRRESDEEQQLYEKAVIQLNALQSNAQTLALARTQQETRPEWRMEETREFMGILGISLDDIDRLNVVHITGTKGKGSTAAFLESILRSLGYKTGFYSSPHLVHVRERIRINGRPISKQIFTQQFFHIYNTLFEHKKEVRLMPAYFKFLTLLAFRIFCDERVDVAIVEVGIGGEYDCTNVIRRPIMCAINTLDLDHTKVLGTTLPQIAWNKAGIAKPGAVMLSVEQPSDAMRVIEERCAERTCPLFIVPPLTDYRWPSSTGGQRPFELGIAGPHQHINASLALQLARIWLLKRHGRHIEADQNGAEMANKSSDTNSNYLQQLLQLDGNNTSDQKEPNFLSNHLNGFALTPGVAQALAKCRWDGRSQLLRQGPNTVFHLDGAHTPQSIKFCAQWFLQSVDATVTAPSVSVIRILLFHCTGDRSSAQLLPNLKDCRFDMALFCPALICPPDRRPAGRSLGQDSTNVNLDLSAELRRCENDQQIWQQIAPGHPSAVFSCVSDALDKVRAVAAENSKSSVDTELHVLVTGSLLLVGDALALLDPNKADE
ncbi:hypothetical protein niasHS_004816 [Heterodera schachtii]|uniref:tetrahydrofolate synthase n=1 Tax=Heterodera schachtii TaxID=97005 RepID=A0ABD2JU11_HETSC